MNKIYMYAHGGSGNHGCEAIVRSTIQMLKQVNQEGIFLISSNPDEDRKYGIDELCNIVVDKTAYSKCSIDFIKAYLSLKLKNDYMPMDKLAYQQTIKLINKGDIALSIGGDNYCYADVDKYIMLHDMVLERGAKTVLWGCSVEPDLLSNPKIREDIKRYSLITARETISYNALKEVNSNTILVSDPAFNLKTETCDNTISDNTVGINISPMIIENEKNSGIARKNYEILIENILHKTELNIALIPHVVWNQNDDRMPLNQLYDRYKNSGRIKIIEDQNCEKIKGRIAQCRFFVGARTHSTIAAYSNSIPTLVVGYSVKARGIARDLFGTEEGYVLPVQTLKEEDELWKEFVNILNREEEIKKRLVEKKNYRENTTLTEVCALQKLIG